MEGLTGDIEAEAVATSQTRQPAVVGHYDAQVRATLKWCHHAFHRCQVNEVVCGVRVKECTGLDAVRHQ
jgi:hypothetical protein